MNPLLPFPLTENTEEKVRSFLRVHLLPPRICDYTCSITVPCHPHCAFCHDVSLPIFQVSWKSVTMFTMEETQKETGLSEMTSSEAQYLQLPSPMS